MSVKYILGFYKEGDLRYISHLDCMRLFQRAFKRAGIRLRHSEGFNPHPKISFAQPLSLGFTSRGEYLEFEGLDDLGPEEVQKRLNQALPAGIGVSSCRKGDPDQRKSLAALVESADYQIRIQVPPGEDWPARIEGLYAAEEILISRQRKKDKSPKVMDIRPLILSLEGSMEGGDLLIRTRLKTGSAENLNPELVAEAFLSFANLPYKRELVHIFREELHFMD